MMLFIVDFDGTVAPTDTVDAFLERFADPEWHRIEDEWAAGRIGSRECMESQLALVSGERAELEQFLRSVTIDPSFPDFVEFVRPYADIAVVSDGIEYPIRHALRQLDVPIYANGLRFLERGVGISFPYSDAACTQNSGVCKCAVARSIDAGRGISTILIGDGRSDYCLAGEADYVFAKGSLRRHCDEREIAYAPFDTFDDVLRVVAAWDEFNEESRGRNLVQRYAR